MHTGVQHCGGNRKLRGPDSEETRITEDSSLFLTIYPLEEASYFHLYGIKDQESK